MPVSRTLLWHSCVWSLGLLAVASKPTLPTAEACGPDHSASITRGLQCPRYLACSLPTVTCTASAAPLTRPTRTTVTRIDGCTTYLSTGAPCATCPPCRESITYGLGGPGCERC